MYWVKAQGKLIKQGKLITQAMNGTSVADWCNHQVLQTEQVWPASCITPAIFIANFINSTIGKSIKNEDHFNW